MQGLPDPDRLRADLAALSSIDRQVVGGLTTLMIAEPERARDLDWLAERFTQLAVVAHGFDDDSTTSAAVATIEAYSRERSEVLLRHALAVFVRVAADLQTSGGGPPYGLDDAFTRVRGYLGSVVLPADEDG